MLGGRPISVQCEQDEGKSVICRSLSPDWGVTEAALNEIKRQASKGCLLCVLDEWPEEDWE